MSGLSAEAEVLRAVIERQLGDLLDQPVVSIPEAGRRAYGCRSTSAAYDLARKGGMAGVLRVGDRCVVSTAQVVGHLLGQLSVDGERREASR